MISIFGAVTEDWGLEVWYTSALLCLSVRQLLVAKKDRLFSGLLFSNFIIPTVHIY